MSRQTIARFARTRLAPMTALGLALGACGPDRAVTGSAYPYDYKARHPIVLAEAPRTLDVFLIGAGGLGRRQRDDVRAFAAEYRSQGQGPLLAQMPSGAGPGAHYTLDAIRATMAEAGLSPAHLAVAPYEVADPEVAAPIRLTFRKLQAKVASKCGLWPQDLGGSDLRFANSNEPYWNLGCATQANLAAQVADPIDLVRGRPETPGDTLRRTKDIQDLRDGKDPSTTYKQDGQNRITTGVGG